MSDSPPYRTALLAGALAGTTVDLSLFPLDTLKTRLQSSAGFFPSGGFSGIYRGVGSALVGSAPGAAFFFVTYEATKDVAMRRLSGEGEAGNGEQLGAGAQAAVHMAAASAGEVAACAVRVPTEIVKQRAQAGLHGGRSSAALRAILSSGSPVKIWRELYRGWGITVFREVPFTIIQFPLWEGLKRWSRNASSSSASASGKGRMQDVGAVESALYGSLSGGIAAALTTPLDVIKTRVMLSKDNVRPVQVCREILREEGWRVLFSGLAPRVTWIGIGGAIFLGSYQWAVNTMGTLRDEE